MVRFGKSAAALVAHKQNFFRDNDALVENNRRLAALYLSEPRRAACKCCDGPLGPPQFTKHDVPYVVCARCGHLNGVHEDGDRFCAALYTDGGGADYAKAYSAADRALWQRRVEDIYLPKALFLRDAIAQCEPAAPLAYADFGAGSGYFVAALRQAGLSRATGFEVSVTQVGVAEAMLGAAAVARHDMADTIELAASVEADVVSMIGVLEHLRQPRAVLAAFASNPRVRYVYLSVPLFSPCVFFELAFPRVFHRHLGGGHTHLYTERSLDWTAREFGMERVAEWWFGTDLFDLFRAVSVELEGSAAAPLWGEMFAPAVDDLQQALDRRKLASEVHMLLRVRDADAQRS